ncbi:MAG: hypothetical protein NC313_13195 [Butyrivibrio sp.]|nr:hypothetical protein [Butyrivibrio sp.]
MYHFFVMHRNSQVAEVQVSDDHKAVKIRKIIADSIIQPFSGKDMSINRVYSFLKSRCYEDGYAGLKEVLEKAGLKDNNPWDWNRISHGVMWQDDIWIRFIGENINWEDVRWKK